MKFKYERLLTVKLSAIAAAECLHEQRHDNERDATTTSGHQADATRGRRKRHGQCACASPTSGAADRRSTARATLLDGHGRT